MNTTTRSRVAATLLVLGPLTLTVGDLLRRIIVPSGSPSAVAITHAVADHQNIWLVAGLLNLAAAVSLVPAALALIPGAGSRGARTTTIGACLVATGSVAAAAHTVAFFSPYALYGNAGTPHSAITAFDDASESYPLLVLVIALFMIGLMLGSLVLFVGLRRARRVPIWAVVAAVVFVACGSSGGVAPGILGVAAALVAFVPAARSLVASTPVAGQPATGGLSLTS
ncbi:hypothetical protein [Flexivirga caeni]|nr:hypothetical protein [Flexivirga caeni]